MEKVAIVVDKGFELVATAIEPVVGRETAIGSTQTCHTLTIQIVKLAEHVIQTSLQIVKGMWGAHFIMCINWLMYKVDIAFQDTRPSESHFCIYSK